MSGCGFLRDYETGFGFTIPILAGYGLSLAMPSWVMSLLEQRDLQLVTYAEGRWGLMDLIACVNGPCRSRLLSGSTLRWATRP